MVLALVGGLAVRPATATGGPEKGEKGAACPDSSQQPDNTPPNCGNDGDNGNEGGGGNPCPPTSHNPGGTPPNCGQCPDQDDDGVCDDDDSCDTVPGPASNNGCPLPCPAPDGDTDGDGVCNSVDNCDTEPGPASNNGCPWPGPCHRGEGLDGNPIAEQAFHEVGSPAPLQHPGATDTGTSANSDDNSSLGTVSRELYESELPAPLGPEAGCATDLVGA